MIIVTYVDNMLITGPDIKEINKVKKSLIDKFKIEDIGLATYFVEVQIV